MTFDWFAGVRLGDLIGLQELFVIIANSFNLLLGIFQKTSMKYKTICSNFTTLPFFIMEAVDTREIVKYFDENNFGKLNAIFIEKSKVLNFEYPRCEDECYNLFSKSCVRNISVEKFIPHYLKEKKPTGEIICLR